MTLSTITDVTLRDGLQAENRTVSTDLKFELFSQLRAIGVDRLEITSFSHPKKIPQLADAEALCSRIFASPPGIATMAFVPNRKGLERLLKFPIEWVSCFVSVSEEFNRLNVGQTIAETLAEIRAIGQQARTALRKIRVYVSTVFGCPYEGPSATGRLPFVLSELSQWMPDEIALSDTIGVATPDDVSRAIALARDKFPREKLALHLHDTYGMGLACVLRGWELGIRSFDGSTGGLGGCPYAKGATGNLATEAIQYLLFRSDLRSKPVTRELRKILELFRQADLVSPSRLFAILERGGTIYGCQ